MRDDPRRNLKWLEQQLQETEAPDPYLYETADLLERVDQLLEEEPDVPAFVQKSTKQSKGQQIEQEHIAKQFDESAAVLTKTKKQLRQEEKLRKKAKINRKIGDLVFLAILECIGILVILGWWLQ